MATAPPPPSDDHVAAVAPDGDVAQVAAGALTPAPRRGRWKWAVRAALGGLVIAALAITGRKYYDELDRLRHVSPLLVVVIALLYLAARALAGYVRRAALLTLGQRTGHAETFMLQMVQAYTNLLVPRGGIGLPALYMNVRHGTSVADFSAVQVLPLTLLQIITMGAAGLICQAILWGAYGVPWHRPIALLFAGVTVGGLLMLKVPLPRGAGRTRVGAFVVRLSDAYRRLGRSRRLLALSVAAHGVTVLIRALRIQLCVLAVGQPVAFSGAFLAALLADLAMIVSVTPAALGIREGILVYAARLVHTTGDVALAAAVLDRLVTTACTIVLGQIGVWRYIRPAMEEALATNRAKAAIAAATCVPPPTAVTPSSGRS